MGEHSGPQHAALNVSSQSRILSSSRFTGMTTSTGNVEIGNVGIFGLKTLSQIPARLLTSSNSLKEG